LNCYSFLRTRFLKCNMLVLYFVAGDLS
jgi:hypothetical protein